MKAPRHPHNMRERRGRYMAWGYGETSTKTFMLSSRRSSTNV